MRSILKIIHDKQIRRIAFPPMGTGFYGISPRLSSRVMLEEINNFLQSENNENKPEEIIICLRDSNEIPAFLENLERDI